MTMAKLEISALEIFRQVAIEGSISGAAEKLHRVQSNISTRIKQLEERLGTVLFLRGRQGLTLTEDGHVLLRYAEQLLALSSEAVDALQDGKPAGRFRIGTMESTAAARLPHILSRYHKLYPDVEIALTTATSGELITRLSDHELDIAFVAEPVTVAGLATQPVFEERLMLIAPASFPALGEVAEISGKTVVAFPEGCAYRRYLNDWLLKEEIVPGTIMSVGSYVAILACVSAGTGFAVVPQSVLEVMGIDGDFKRYELPAPLSEIKTLAAWREGYASPKLTALRALVSD